MKIRDRKLKHLREQWRVDEDYDKEDDKPEEK
jgi:hypothetical protein